jgi:hypothetical protein
MATLGGHFMTRFKTIVATLAVLLSTVSRVNAQADARDYEALSNLPNHTSAVWVYYRHITAQNSKTSYALNLAMFRATHLLRFGNWAFTPFDAILPVADMELHTSFTPDAPALKASIFQTGIGDPIYAPTLGYSVAQGKPEDFTHTYVGFTPFLTFPLGTYKATNALNIGENRWVFKPHVTVGQRLFKMLTLELGANVQIFGKNDDVLAAGPTGAVKMTTEQKVTFNMESHLAADVHESMFVSASYFLSKVGEVEAKANAGGPSNTVAKDYTLHTMRFNWGVFLSPSRMTLLLLQFQQDLKGGDGVAPARYVGLRFSHVFLPPEKK